MVRKVRGATDVRGRYCQPYRRKGTKSAWPKCRAGTCCTSHELRRQSASNQNIRHVVALHLLHVHFVEDFLDGYEFDDFAGAFVEVRAFVLGVGGECEGDEEAAGAVFAHHGGFEGVDVGAADFVALLERDFRHTK